MKIRVPFCGYDDGALDLPTFLSSLTSELNQLHGSVSIVHHTHLSKHRGVSVWDALGM